MWTAIHSGVVLGALAFSDILGVGATAVALAAAGSAAFLVLALYGRAERFRAADWVTSVRPAIGVGFLLFVAANPSTGSVAVAIVLLLAETSDFVDGMLARRDGPTEFGAFWDAETDAYFILVLAFGARAYLGLDRWVVLAGVFRYAFFFVFLPLAELPSPPKAFSWFAKTACATAVVLLAAAYVPIIPSPVRSAMAAIATAALAVSFAWELVLRIRGAGE